MNQQLIEVVKKLSTDFELYARVALKIRTKSGEVLPLSINRAQQYIHKCLEEQKKKTGKVRALILKGRQQGCSTLVEARFFWRTVFTKGIRTFILTHEDAATSNLFEMSKRFYEYLPPELKPAVNTQNAKELMFESLDSGYKVGTAGNKAVGRSSTMQLFHGSECAYWPNAEEHAMGILQTVPNSSGTEIIMESTANGIGNYFHAQWQLAERGESDFQAIFVPWYWQDEYKKLVDDFSCAPEEHDYMQTYGLDLSQMAWRRSKIAELSVLGTDGSWRFKQEYPATATEAFVTSGDDSLIKPEWIMAARKANTSPYGPLLVGVDPARFGNDRTSIIYRKGRVVFNLKSYRGKDNMEVAALCVDIFSKEDVGRMFIDVGGLGAGVVDRLRELGYGDRIEAVNFGERALDSEKYSNRRAECWGLMAAWFQDKPCQIPDSDTLHGDLMAPQYKHDTNSRLVIEKKDDIKKRGLMSPDEADALALTFATPVGEASWMKDPYRAFKRYG